jgi:hypothetical protein
MDIMKPRRLVAWRELSRRLRVLAFIPAKSTGRAVDRARAVAPALAAGHTGTARGRPGKPGSTELNRPIA